MATLAITPQSRVADRVMGAYFRLQVEEGTFREDTTPAFSADTLALCEMFGMTPVKLHYAGADRRLQFEAFIVNDPADRRIYLTNHAKSPERALIGHELVHRMRRERPKLYDSLVRALGDAGEAHDRWIAYYTAMREQTQRKEGRALSNDEIREEGVADLVGDLLLDPAVWRALRQPTLLQRVADWIGSVWKRLRRAQAPVDPLGGGGLIRDRKRAMAAVTRVLGDWADSLARPSPADPDYAPAPANATLRRDPNAPAGAFRSALLDALVAGKGAPVQAPWQQWLGWLDGAQRRGEFRQSERAWLGLDAWMGQWKGPIPRQALVDYVRAHQVQINEVVLEESREAVDARLAGEFERQGYTLSLGEDRGTAAHLYFDRNGDEIAFDELPGELRALVAAADQCVVPKKHLGYRLPGGRDYRELLLTLPVAGGDPLAGKSREQLGRLYENEIGYDPIEDDPSISTDALRDMVRGLPRAAAEAGTVVSAAISAGFQSTHYVQSNVLVHVRFNERTDADGKRVLFIEEIQSDWHQTGRKKGYAIRPPKPDAAAHEAAMNSFDESEARGENAADWRRNNPEHQAVLQQGFEHDTWGDYERGAVPDAPFKSTDEWVMLAFKRMVVWAAEHGFDRIAWTTGEQQAGRYDLSKQVERIEWENAPASPPQTRVTIHTPAGKEVLLVQSADGVVRTGTGTLSEAKGKPLDAVIGKGLADTIMGSPNGELAGDGLKIGGAGIRGFYDDILPRSVNQWAKKFGAQVGQAEMGAGPRQLFIDGGNGEYVVRDSLTMEGVTAPVATLVEAEAYHAAHAKEAPATFIAPALDITPAMRDAALAGLPLFKRATIVPTGEPDPREALYSFAP